MPKNLLASTAGSFFSEPPEAYFIAKIGTILFWFQAGQIWCQIESGAGVRYVICMADMSKQEGIGCAAEQCVSL